MRTIPELLMWHAGLSLETCIYLLNKTPMKTFDDIQYDSAPSRRVLMWSRINYFALLHHVVRLYGPIWSNRICSAQIRSLTAWSRIKLSEGISDSGVIS